MAAALTSRLIASFRLVSGIKNAELRVAPPHHYHYRLFVPDENLK